MHPAWSVIFLTTLIGAAQGLFLALYATGLLLAPSPELSAYLVAGDLVVRSAPILFSDLHIFDHWDLRGQPALLIGMDVLGVVDTLVIDYRLHELHIKPR